MPHWGDAIFAQENGRPWTAKALTGKLTKLGRDNPDAAGIGFHSLRHTFVTRALNAGASLQEVGRIVGHSSTVMTLHYASVEARRLRRVSEAVAESIGSKES